jgi:nickel/cobalt transporter (NiCoT) family protein
MRIKHLFNDEPEAQRAKIFSLFVLVVTANVAAWILAFLLLPNQPTLLGTAFLAYTFGLRHAIDTDHIAAIDNVARKLLQQGKRPLSVGLFFSLGHSTVVVLGTVVVAAVAAAMQHRLASFKSIGSIIGTSISAIFLLVIAVVNLVILIHVWETFRYARRGGHFEPEKMDLLLSGRGILARLFRGLFRVVSGSWHMYPLGFLFGLGFDTATEIGLLGLSATQVAQGMSLWSMLIFPALFTCGMALVDTADGILMVGAYGWAFANPIRKLWYNLTITAVSVLVALFIGGVEALGLLANKLGLQGRFWIAISNLSESLGAFGFIVIGAFVTCWTASALIYYWNRYDELADQPSIARREL